MNRCCQTYGSNLSPAPGNAAGPGIPHFPSEATDTLVRLTLRPVGYGRLIQDYLPRAFGKSLRKVGFLSANE